MPYAFVKTVANTANSNVLTFSPTNAGDLLIFLSITSSGGGTPTASITDNLGSTWSTAKATVQSTTGNWITEFYLPNCPAGITSITTTYVGGTPGTCNTQCIEYSGIATTTPLLTASTPAAQTSPGTATDAITTGNVTVSGAPMLFFAWSYNSDGGQPNSGTGFASQGSTHSDTTFEDRRFTVSGTYAATFTAVAGHDTNHYITGALAFQEAVSSNTLVGQDGTGWTQVDTTENLFTAGAFGLSAGYTGVSGTANKAFVQFGASGGGTSTVKVCLYDSGGTLINISSPITFIANTLCSATFPTTTITAQNYNLVLTPNAGGPHVLHNNGANAFALEQFTSAHFPYATPPGSLPASDSSAVGHEFIMYLTGSTGSNSYTLSLASVSYALSVSAASLGSGNNYVLPATAVMYDRVVGSSTEDQILEVFPPVYHLSIGAMNFLPAGGRLSVASVVFSSSIGGASFSHGQAAVNAATPCSFDFPNYPAFRLAVQQLIDGDDVSQSSLSTTVLDLIISLGERRIYRDVRSSAQDTALSLTVTGNSAPLPVDLIELRSVYLPTGVPLIYMPYEQLQEKLQIHGTSARKPYYYTFEGDNLIFYPMQGDGTTISGRYYKRFCSIVTEGLSGNTYFNRFPDLWIYASLLECGPYIGEATRMPIWEQKYQETVAAVASYERRRFTRGSKLSIRVS